MARPKVLRTPLYKQGQAISNAVLGKKTTRKVDKLINDGYRSGKNIVRSIQGKGKKK